MILDIVNIGAAVLSIATCVLVWKLYKLTNSHSILSLLFAVLWGASIRVGLAVSLFVPFWTFTNTAAYIAGFWVLFPIGMYGLLRTLRKYYHGK